MLVPRVGATGVRTLLCTTYIFFHRFALDGSHMTLRLARVQIFTDEWGDTHSFHLCSNAVAAFHQACSHIQLI